MTHAERISHIERSLEMHRAILKTSLTPAGRRRHELVIERLTRALSHEHGFERELQDELLRRVPALRGKLIVERGMT
jgi:hypothetical protein